jgi:hypothetical protein
MCDLPPEIVDVIAAHEHLPAVLAAELGNCLACSNSGLALIHRFIQDQVGEALEHGDSRHLDHLLGTLARFRDGHPGLPPA